VLMNVVEDGWKKAREQRLCPQAEL
jgi:hypothetical protein